MKSSRRQQWQHGAGADVLTIQTLILSVLAQLVYDRTQAAILTDVKVHFPMGFTGIVGANGATLYPGGYSKAQAGDRVAITGVNGAGKSTLLRTIVDSLRIPHEHVILMPQEITAAHGANILAEVRSALGNETHLPNPLPFLPGNSCSADRDR
jgi:ABC-type Mn2+/Zn2+ transport system ATPase subunit